MLKASKTCVKRSFAISKAITLKPSENLQCRLGSQVILYLRTRELKIYIHIFLSHKLRPKNSHTVLHSYLLQNWHSHSLPLIGQNCIYKRFTSLLPLTHSCFQCWSSSSTKTFHCGKSSLFLATWFEASLLDIKHLSIIPLYVCVPRLNMISLAPQKGKLWHTMANIVQPYRETCKQTSALLSQYSCTSLATFPSCTFYSLLAVRPWNLFMVISYLLKKRGKMENPFSKQIYLYLIIWVQYYFSWAHKNSCGTG